MRRLISTLLGILSLGIVIASCGQVEETIRSTDAVNTRHFSEPSSLGPLSPVATVSPDADPTFLDPTVSALGIRYIKKCAGDYRTTLQCEAHVCATDGVNSFTCKPKKVNGQYDCICDTNP